jgi:transcription initiation factor TFIIIB Brf1 subunit/transcription initiation factor TFIIB
MNNNIQMSQKNNNINIENLDTLESFDDLDILDCNDYFQNIYDRIITTDIKNDDNSCPNCKSTEFIEDSTLGFIVCNCGQVISNLFDHRSETRVYEDDQKQQNVRCSKVTNVLLPQSSLGTRLPDNVKGSLKKLQIWNAMPYRERSLYNDFKKINACCEKMGLKKNIQETANIYYTMAKSCKYEDNQNKYIIMRGKNNRGVQGGTICLSCKKNNIPFNAKDICDHFNLSIKELNNGIKTLISLLKSKKFDVEIENLKSDSYIRKYCLESNVKPEYMDEAIRISNNINKLNLASEHNQFSIAACSMLIMAENNNIVSMSKKKLRMMFGVSEVTISKTYKKIEKVKHILNDDKKVSDIYNKINRVKVEDNIINPQLLDRMKQFNIPIPVPKTNIKYIVKKEKVMDDISEEYSNEDSNDSNKDSNNDSNKDSNEEQEDIKIVLKNDKKAKPPTKKNIKN